VLGSGACIHSALETAEFGEICAAIDECRGGNVPRDWGQRGLLAVSAAEAPEG
jgi:hypothetical protein